MAAKFDGKRASENHWVMQQNLAKQKGGRPPRWFQQPQARFPKPRPAAPAKVNDPAPVPASEAAAESTQK